MEDSAGGAPPDIRPVPPPDPVQDEEPVFDSAPVWTGPGFGGTFITDDAVLEGSLEFQGKRLVMWGGGNPLLAWNPGECLLERLTANRFVLSADGETITFTADDPEDLESAENFPLYGPSPGASPSRQPSKEMAKPTGSFETSSFETSSFGSNSFQGTESFPAVETASRELFPSESSAPEPSYFSKPVEELPPFQPEAPEDPEPPDEAALPQSPEPEVAPSFGVRRTYIKAVRPLRAVEDVEEASPEPEPFADDDLPAGDTISEPFVDDYDTDVGATIADDAVIRARRFTSVTAARWWTREVQTAAIKVAVVSGVVVVVMGFAFGVMILMGGFQSDSPGVAAPSPTTSIVTVPTTTPVTAATPNTVPLTTSVFELSGSDFAERWNVLASDLDENLILSPNLTNPFSLVLTPFVTFDGVLDPASGSLRLRAAPTGTAEGDRSILVALALVIGTAEPSLTPANRGQLLEALGLDPSNPQLGGINGVRTYHGRMYELIYLSEEGILQFTVRPETASVDG
ncbi:MAG TPA: hypothetical protein VM470_09125 [Acidimicrobiia bacterium]|nr:hypothetical protein [Acidimicrobiia bacterium]